MTDPHPTVPGATYPGPPGSGRTGRAARDAWDVQLRCQAVVAALAVLATVAVAVGSHDDGAAGLMAFVWLVHALVTLVVGFPVGVVVGRQVPAGTTAPRAAAWFAVAGAVTGGLLTLATAPATAVVYALLGGVVAGGARAWAHAPIERRRAARDAAAERPAGVVLPPEDPQERVPATDAG